MPPASEHWIQQELAALRSSGLERTTAATSAVGGKFSIDGKPFLNFAANDYLDLAANPRVLERAEQALCTYGAGSTASRLMSGTLALHEELEHELAVLKGYPSALLFGTGYMTNAGVIPCLAGRSDRVYADRLVHASIVDAITLSRAKLLRFRHNDVDHLQGLLKNHAGQGRHLVITESVFSMDGDLAPLKELAEVAQQSGATLMVDEAHATGVFGPQGAGLVRNAGIEHLVSVSMGTLSKALGGYGGFVACSELMRSLFINKARSFIYTTAPPPAAVGAALGAIDELRKAPSLGKTLLERATAFRDMLRDLGANTLNSNSQILPVLIGENEAAVAISKRLRTHGIIAPAIRPPTVPAGTARLRLSVTLAHQPEDLVRTAELITEAMRDEGVLS